MTTTEDVKKLSELVRIKIDDANLDKFTKEFDAILAYVGQLEQLSLPDSLNKEKPSLRNVMRQDCDPSATGACTKKLVEQFPKKEGDALSVRQVITYD